MADSIIVSIAEQKFELRLDPGGAGGGAGGAVLQGSGSYTQNTGTVRFSNSNSITFGLNTNGVMTASFSQSAHPFAGTSISTVGTNDSLLLGAAGAAGISFSVPAWITTAPAGSINFSAGSTSNNLQSVSFANGSGVSFGLNAGTITASVSHTPQTGISRILVSDTTFTQGDVSFSNLNGVSFGSNGAGVITASVLAAGGFSGGVSNVGNSGGNTGITGSVLVFSGGNNVTLSQSTHANGATIMISGPNTAAQSQMPSVISLNGSSGQMSIMTVSSLSAVTNGSTISIGLASDVSSMWSGQTTANQSRVVDINGSSNSISFATGSSMSSSQQGSTITWGIASNISTAWSGQTTANQSRVVVVNASSGDISFVVGSSLSAVTNGSTISLGLATNWTSAIQSVGAYLTTALGTVTAVTGGSMTGNSNGLSVNIPQGTLYFSDGSGISWGSVVNNTSTTITGSIITSALSSGLMPLAYSSGFQTATLASTFVQTANSSLFQHTSATSVVTSAAFPSANTTKFAGAGFTTTATAGTEVVGTHDSLGFKIGVPAFITTYAAGGSVEWSVATTNAGTDIIISTGAATNTLYHPAYLTTGGGGSINFSVTGGSANLNSVMFGEGSGVTWGLAGSTITASVATGLREVQATNGTLNVATLHFVDSTNIRISADGASLKFSVPDFIASSSSTRFVGINTSTSSTSGVDIKMSLNSSGATFSVPAWITTAMASGESHIRRIAVSGSNYESGSVEISGSRNVTVTYNASTISIYGPANILNSFSISGNTGTTGSSDISGGGFILAGGSNITISQSNNSISFHGPQGTIVFQDSNGHSFVSSVGTGTASLITTIYISV